MDYAFANTLTLTGEFYYDGAGSSDVRSYDFAALVAGQVRNLGRRYAGLSASHEISPVLTTRHDVVVNLDDHSRYYAPSLTWSIRDDLDATLGAQLFGGAPGTEFGFFQRVLHVQFQWFRGCCRSASRCPAPCCSSPACSCASCPQAAQRRWIRQSRCGASDVCA